MIDAILEAVTVIFGVTAVILFWKLANKLGVKFSFNRLILILFGLALILLAIGCF